MSVFSDHIVKTSYFSVWKALISPIKPNNNRGLIHAECMTAMTLGSHVFSLSRFLSRQLIVFAQWEDETAINNFINNSSLGKKLSKGWHVRLNFLRQWGSFAKFEIPDENFTSNETNNPVVAVTIARMKLLQIPRFIHWGRPVEKLVHDHPATLLSFASIRFPRTVSTFSIWTSLQEMKNMVQGHSAVPFPKRHLNAMKERDRKDFHIEFTTLRFNPLSEFGKWNGKENIISSNTVSQ